jgi:glucose-1-phosphate cytidylyltransferase
VDRRIDGEPDLDDWRITFVDTGLHSNLGQRLLRVKTIWKGRRLFWRTTRTGLTDLPFNEYLGVVLGSGATASFTQRAHGSEFPRGPHRWQGIVTDLGRVSESSSGSTAASSCSSKEF